MHPGPLRCDYDRSFDFLCFTLLSLIFSGRIPQTKDAHIVPDCTDMQLIFFFFQAGEGGHALGPL